jgi:ATP phosphoribosyltransferase
MKGTKLRIAIQSNGRLREGSLSFLERWGLHFSRTPGRALLIPSTNGDAEVVFVRHSDIPQYVQFGAADLGIVGENVLCETHFNVDLVKRLGFGKCRLIVAVPENASIRDVAGLEGERIATTYPNSLRKWLKKNQVNASIIEICGAVEVTTLLGLSDGICDLMETGRTLKENGLVPIAEVLESQAVLIRSRKVSEATNRFLETILAVER